MIKLWVKFHHEYLVLFNTNVYHTFLEKHSIHKPKKKRQNNAHILIESNF